MVEVIGLRRMEGTSKKNGRPYAGYMIWYKEQQEGVTGFATGDAFLSDTVLGGMAVNLGDTLELRYNKNGFLTSVELA